MKKTDIVISPLVTEKTSQLVQNKIYTFKVHKESNKNQIAEIVTDLYGVEVDKVRIVIRKGKEKKVGRRMMAKKRPDIKMAYITLKKGTIDLFPQS